MNSDWPWIEEHQRELARYCGEYVAVGDGRILAHSPSAGDVIKAGRASGLEFFIMFVPISWRRVRIYPIRTRSIRRTSWEPLYQVTLAPGTDRQIRVQMLVDSGADVCCISRDTGEELGLVASPSDLRDTAEGLGGTVEYVGRAVEIEIDGHRITVPVAWFQTPEPIDPILGRETVFDCFDILIRQRDREIELRWRGPPQE
ncbi:MAG: retropepsin-like domain-containing protein [Planctomycetes bacterium]|nr:retropepsin-like domain-containing protein [Planctomycetota bacterium]